MRALPRGPPPPAGGGALPHAGRENRVWNAYTLGDDILFIIQDVPPFFLTPFYGIVGKSLSAFTAVQKL